MFRVARRTSVPPRTTRTTEGEGRMRATRRSLTNAKVERIPASGIRRFFDLARAPRGSSRSVSASRTSSPPSASARLRSRRSRTGKRKYTSKLRHRPLRRGDQPAHAKLRGVATTRARDPRHRRRVRGRRPRAARDAQRRDEVVIADPSYVAYVAGHRARRRGGRAGPHRGAARLSAAAEDSSGRSRRARVPSCSAFRATRPVPCSPRTT